MKFAARLRGRAAGAGSRASDRPGTGRPETGRPDFDRPDFDRLVPIRRDLGVSDAQMLRGVLEAAGIHAALANENMGSLHYVVATDLLVRAGDETRARDILARVATMPRPKPLMDEDGEPRACPTCGSEHLRVYAGPVPTPLPGLRGSAGPADGWFQCLQCASLFSDRPRARFSALPLALIWAATLGSATLGLIWLINWLKWL